LLLVAINYWLLIVLILTFLRSFELGTQVRSGWIWSCEAKSTKVTNDAMAQNSAENLEKIYKNSVEKLQQSLKSTELTGAILNLIYYNDLAALNLKFNKFKTASLYCRRATLIIPQLNNEGNFLN